MRGRNESFGKRINNPCRISCGEKKKKKKKKEKREKRGGEMRAGDVGFSGRCTFLLLSSCIGFSVFRSSFCLVAWNNVTAH